MPTLPQMQRLLDIMARLRNPEGGCPWDLEQTYASIVPYTIEEAYEVAEAIHKGDMDELKLELGDLLLQVVFYAQMASEDGLFNFDDVAQAVSDKMVHRHPHVFGEEAAPTLAEYKTKWEAIKAEERKHKPALESILSDVPLALPALQRAEKLQKRAARVGFDWPNTEHVYDKIAEELQEVREAKDNAAVKEEIGDLLFVVANLARHHQLDPEDALRDANRKFERRFQHIEQTLKAAGRNCEDASLDEMEALWIEAKKQEKKHEAA